MPEVGSLSVSVVNGDASFSTAGARGEFDQLGKGAQVAGEQVNFSMREARGGMMLLEHEMGFTLPREMNTLIASIPGIGLAFQALLPILGAVFAVELILKWHEAAKKAQEDLEKGWVSSGDAIRRHNDELQVSIEKYKLLIDKLEHKPASGLALEMAEARVEADKLAASLEKDLDALIKLMQATAHGSIMTMLLGTSGSGQAEDVAKGLRDSIAKIPHDSHFSENMEAALKEAWHSAQSEIQKNNATNAQQVATRSEALSEGRSTTNLPLTDFTAANTALQEFQSHLSASYSEMDLVGKNDAFKKQAEDMTLASAAAKKEATDAEKLFTEIEKKRKEYADAVLKMDKKEATDAEKLFKEIEKANEERVHTMLVANERLNTEETRHNMEMAKLEETGDVQQAESRYKLGMDSEQKLLTLKKQYLELQYAADRDALVKKLELYKQDPDKDAAALENVQNKILELDKDHANKVASLDEQSAEARKKNWDTVFGAINNGFSSTVQGMMQGTQTLTQGMKNLFQNILLSFDQMIEAMVMKAIESKLFGMFAHAFGGGGVPGIGSMPAGGALPAGLPMFAGGGSMYAGEAGIIGDAGPELWIPDSAGTVVPNSALSSAGSGSNINIVIHAENAQSPAEVEQRIRMAINQARAGIVSDSVKATHEHAARH